MSARAHHALLMATGGGSYVDDYVTPYGVWSAEKKLIRAYSGPAIRVRRSSDNAEQDIAFAAGLLDTAALLSFTGSNSGYVTKIYQQVAALTGADLAQTGAGQQPRIVNAGTLEADYAWHDGSDDYLRASLPAGGIASAAATVFARARIDAIAPSGVPGGCVDFGYGGVRSMLLYYDPRAATGTPGVTCLFAFGGSPFQARGFPTATRDITGGAHNITFRANLAATGASDSSLHIYADGTDTGQTWASTSEVDGTFDFGLINTGRNEVYGLYGRIGLHSMVLVASDALAQRANIEALL